MRQVLSERKQKILDAVINEYVTNAEPVGSRTIARRYSMKLSPATIRNEMADLEDMGLLEQPHTSAGRIPSHKGYRFFVDNLMGDFLLNKDEQNTIRDSLDKAREIEKVISEASRVLSAAARHTSLILGPQFRNSSFHQMKILPLNERQGLVVLITGLGFIKNRVIDLPKSLTAGELQQVVGYLNRKLFGLTIDQVTESLVNELKRDLFRRMELLEQAFLLLEESLKEEEKVRVFLGGTTNILNQPEFMDVDKIKKFLNLFEQDHILSSLLEGESEKKEGVIIRIGKENQLKDIHECTLVTCTFSIGKGSVGRLGVLGPTRMNYARVVSLVKFMARHLNRVFEENIN